VGGGATIGPAGAGAKSTAKRETLQSDGDEAACTHANATDKTPPEGCGALIQIEVMGLTAGSRPLPPPPPPLVVAPPVPAPTVETPPPAPSPPKRTPRCKAGLHVEDGKCVKNTKRKPPPPPTVTNVASAAPTCTATQKLVDNKCVDDAPAPVDLTPQPASAPPPPPTCAANERFDGTTCVALARPRPNDVKTPNVYDTPAPQDQMMPNPLRTLFMYSAIGFGILAAGAGSVALGAANDATDGCLSGPRTCPQDAIDKRSTAVTAAVVSDIGLGLTVASLIGFFLVPAHIKAPSVGIAPTKNGVAATTGWSFW
jgi:hypothetical protein